jgi:hypothetical protein
MTSLKDIVNEIGMTKRVNRGKKKDLETYGHDETPKSDAGVKRAQNAMKKTKLDKSGAIARASYRQAQVESVVLEGLIKKMNKEKKRNFETAHGERLMKSSTPSPNVDHSNADNRAKQATKSVHAQVDKPGAKKTVKSGFKQRAYSRQVRQNDGGYTKQQQESIIIEGLIKKMNKGKKNAAVDAAGGRDKIKSEITPGSKNATSHAELSLAQTMRKAGNKRLAKAVLDGSKSNRESIIQDLKDLLNEKKDYLQRGPNAFKRSEIKAGMEKEEPGAGKEYIKVAAEKRAKSNAALTNKDDRSKAAATVQSTAAKLDAEPNDKGKLTKGAFRKAVTGSPSTGKFTPGGLKPGASGEDGRLNAPAKKVTNKPVKGLNGTKGGTPVAPLSKDQINKSGVTGKPGEAASKDKFDKLDKVPAFDKQAARRKMLANKLIAMRGKK